MNAGQTMIIPLPGTSYDSHLWFVISDMAFCSVVPDHHRRFGEQAGCFVTRNREIGKLSQGFFRVKRSNDVL